MKRHTLVFHSYLGYGGYIVEYQRIQCSDTVLKRYKRKADVHFIISGWPKITHPNGEGVQFNAN